MKKLFLLIISLPLMAIDILDKPIIFDDERIRLTREYLKAHYGLSKQNIKFTPRILVIHWTSINDLERSFKRFLYPKLPSDRPDIQMASPLNVSAHFMIDRDGSIYRLMDETTVARHVIGLNYSAIGIENVGGKNEKEDLTQEQLKSNISLIRYLQDRHSSLEYLIGHHEYRRFENHPLWMERQQGYRTTKHDPGVSFMRQLRLHITDLKAAP